MSLPARSCDLPFGDDPLETSAVYREIHEHGRLERVVAEREVA